MFTTLVYSEPEEYSETFQVSIMYRLCNVKHIYDEVFYLEPFLRAEFVETLFIVRRTHALNQP